jgi:pimeloyl-ACP methyl ester carboxylesterase
MAAKRSPGFVSCSRDQGKLTNMSIFTHADGTQTAYDMTGEGPPVLLIHGAEGSRRSFDRLVPLLSAQFCVIAYDQRDCGETQNGGPAADLARLGDDADELLNGLGLRPACVFGTSFGGRVAQALAIRHPGRIDRLALGSTWAVPHTLATLNGEVAAEVTRLRAALPGSAEQLATYFFPPDFLAAQPAFRQHFSKAPVRSERSARRGETVGSATALEASNITAQTLLLAGGSDRLIPADLTRAMMDHIAGSAFVTLDGVGHITYVQAPHQVADRLIEFFSQARDRETM